MEGKWVAAAYMKNQHVIVTFDRIGPRIRTFQKIEH
jgi:hypothetical protein